VYLVRHALYAHAARRLGLPTVSSPRGGLMPKALARRALKKRLGDALFFDNFSRQLALHRALCEAERAACVRRYPEVPVRIAGNPIDLRAVPHVDPPRATCRPLTIGYLGRLDVEHKGLDLLVAGLSLAVAEHGADLWLRICGPDDRGGARRLERLIAAHGLGARVELVGPAEGPVRYRFLESLDVFVHPSRFEGLPMGVLEAMAVARPVLVTPETNLADVVERHGAGWIAEGSAAGVARALAAVASSGSDVAARGAAARRAVRQEFSLDAVGAQLTAAYADVLHRAAARAA
jgi:glycosyltransferase involved in cell wall biosynthesis